MGLMPKEDKALCVCVLFIYASCRELVQRAVLCSVFDRRRRREKCLAVNKMMAPARCQRGSLINHCTSALLQATTGVLAATQTNDSFVEDFM